MQVGLKERYNGVWPFISYTNTIRCGKPPIPMLSYLMRQHPNLSGRPTRRRDGASTRLALYFTGPSAPALDLKVLVSSHLSNPAPHFVFSSLHVCFAIAPYPPLLSQHHLVHHFVACVVYSPMSPRVVCAGLILSRKPHSLEQNPGNLHSSKKDRKSVV